MLAADDAVGHGVAHQSRHLLISQMDGSWMAFSNWLVYGCNPLVASKYS